ncbi:MAG: tetratricopeptide repeat protein [Cyanobacteria bacterium P01_A01_bin.105]
MSVGWQMWYQQQVAKLAYRHGCTYTHQGKYDRAIATFTQALTHHPNPAKVHTARGLSHWKQAERDAALADFERAIALDPSQAQAYGNRGLLRYEAGDEVGALGDWQQALTLAPHYAEVYYSRALLYMAHQDHDSALKDLDQALALSPNLAEAYFHRGNLREQMGQMDQAVQDWHLAICNDLSFDETKAKLTAHQSQNALPSLTSALQQALSERQLSLQVQANDYCLNITVHREVGVGISYYQLPDLIRGALVPLELADFTRFKLVGYVGDVKRPEWNQTYDLYKGQPCPPSNWQSALSAFVTCPPFGITALIYALQVQNFYKRGYYPDALRASQTVRRLSRAGAGILCGLTLIPFSYTAYTSLQSEPTPPQRTARSIDAPLPEAAPRL